MRLSAIRNLFFNKLSIIAQVFLDPNTQTQHQIIPFLPFNKIKHATWVRKFIEQTRKTQATKNMKDTRENAADYGWNQRWYHQDPKKIFSFLTQTSKHQTFSNIRSTSKLDDRNSVSLGRKENSKEKCRNFLFCGKKMQLSPSVYILMKPEPNLSFCQPKRHNPQPLIIYRNQTDWKQNLKPKNESILKTKQIRRSCKSDKGKEKSTILLGLLVMNISHENQTKAS